MLLGNFDAANRILIAAVFLIAGLLKLRRQEPPLIKMISIFGRTSNNVRRTAFRLLSVLEIGIGIILLTPWLTVVALITAAALLALFTGLLLAAWKRGYEGDCGCFGDLGSDPVGWAHIGPNCILITLALFGAGQAFITGHSKALWQLDRWDIFIVSFSGAIFFALRYFMLHLESILRNLKEIR